jgi:hypothetical protein
MMVYLGCKNGMELLGTSLILNIVKRLVSSAQRSNGQNYLMICVMMVNVVNHLEECGGTYIEKRFIGKSRGNESFPFFFYK